MAPVFCKPGALEQRSISLDFRSSRESTSPLCGSSQQGRSSILFGSSGSSGRGSGGDHGGGVGHLCRLNARKREPSEPP